MQQNPLINSAQAFSICRDDKDKHLIQVYTRSVSRVVAFNNILFN